MPSSIAIGASDSAIPKRIRSCFHTFDWPSRKAPRRQEGTPPLLRPYATRRNPSGFRGACTQVGVAGTTGPQQKSNLASTCMCTPVGIARDPESTVLLDGAGHRPLGLSAQPSTAPPPCHPCPAIAIWITFNSPTLCGRFRPACPPFSASVFNLLIDVARSSISPFQIDRLRAQ